MSEEQLEKEVRQCLADWEQARKEHDELRHQYYASGPLLPGQPIRRPEKILTADVMEKLEQASENEKSAEQTFNEAIRRWRSSHT